MDAQPLSENVKSELSKLAIESELVKRELARQQAEKQKQQEISKVEAEVEIGRAHV